MRVYEFSKQYGIPSKELLGILDEAGFSIPSHMSVLTEDALNFLNKKFKVATIAKEVKAENVKQHIKEIVAPVAMINNEKSITHPKESVVAPSDKNEAVSAHIPKKEIDIKKVQSAAIAHSSMDRVSHEQEKATGSLIIESMRVNSFSERTKRPVSEIIMTLLKWGIVAAKNQILSETVVERLAKHFEIPTEPKQKERYEKEEKGSIAVSGENLTTRPPVIVVLGHVDHGKTTLLDFIRKTRVAAREKGGITQHLGAYEATTPQGNVVFIDTPGHEAFSKMRSRGIKVADLVVLVVAADDSVMPQTIEAIKQAKAMNVPIIVAINKMDKVDITRLEAVKRDLAAQDLLPEEWGGEVVLAPISAKTGQGVGQLLDMIILQSQMMELKADLSGPAQGHLLEAKLEKGRGPVATLLCQHGIIHVGDYFISGSTHGKVSSLVDSRGQRINEAGPSIPVLVAGFNELPNAGDYFTVVSLADYKKAIKAVSIEQKMVPAAAFIETKGINIIIKTDTNSSKDAILGALHKLSKKFEKKFTVVQAGIGGINESDVEFAAATKSSIYALHIKAGPGVLSLAQKLGVAVHIYDIIYKMLEAFEAVAEGAKEIKKIKTKIGEAVVRQVFNIKGLGVIAGCYITDGRFSKDGSVIIFRGNRKIGEGKIKSLQRDKKSVKEVHAGFECGFIVEGFEDWAIDDRAECFIEVPEQPKKS